MAQCLPFPSRPRPLRTLHAWSAPWALWAPCSLWALCALSGAVVRLAEKPLCPPPPARCSYGDSVMDEHFYNVDELSFRIIYSGTYLAIECPASVSLESASMPRFARAVRVQRVQLRRCAPPRGPYARALARLNVTVLDHLLLDEPDGRLRAFHFEGVDVSALSLHAAEPFLLEPGTFAPLRSLLDLRLTDVPLTAADLSELPPELRRLSITGSNVTALSEEALGRLTSLVHLTARETKLTAAPDLSPLPSLRDVVIIAPVDVLPSSASVENVTLWRARGLEVRGACTALLRLDVYGARVPLPPRWLAECTRLSSLSLKSMDLRNLPGDLLHSALDVNELTVKSCNLSALPADLLAQSRKLLVLDLSDNKLEVLPQGLFAAVRALRELRLGRNRLTRLAAAPAFALRSLHHLALSDNPLGDLCDDGSDGSDAIDGSTDVANDIYLQNALSELWQMRELRVLELQRTGATRLCADWRRHMRALGRLDLKRNNITRLEAADLQWERDVSTRVLLQGNALRSVSLSPADYASALAAPQPAFATEFEMDATLTCDCHAYWTVQLVRARTTVPVRNARCQDRRALLSLQPDELVCELPAAACAPNCGCRLRGTRLHMTCSGVGLLRAPRPPPGTPPAAALLLPNNSIASLSPADLPPELQSLDVSGNRIAELDVETVGALFATARDVRLARNPLACRCGAALFTALHAHPERVLDFGELTCAGGARLAALRPSDLCRARALHTALGAAAGALLLAAGALAAFLGRRAARLRLKRFLFERGLCLRWLLRETPDPDERRYEYDVFVSFSHHDEKFVTERLVPELEGGARPYRLCLHYRDWTPGEWIPAQIARSVRESRRTLLVLSEHWVQSTWARAEFREAHAAALADARPRVVSLLLAEPDALRGLDPDLRAFLSANTYLRWGDPWFWPKLRHALPRGVAPAAAPAAAPQDAPAPATPPAAPAPPAPRAGEAAPLNTAPVA